MRHKLLAAVTCAGLLVVSAAYALDPTRAIAQFHHTSWSTEDGIPADIWSIAQTPDGYLWLGSVNGLYRFDGVHVERIAADRLPSPSIHALAATPTGGLWIGYERPVGVISLLQDGVVTNFAIHAQTSTSVHSIVRGPDQSAWASTPDQILRFDGKEWRSVDSDWGSSLGEASGGVWAFGVARDGVVWSKNPRGLFYLKPGTSRFVRSLEHIGGEEAFTSTPDGRLWTIDPVAGRPYALPDLIGTVHPVVSAPTRSMTVREPLSGPILLDRDGTLWCAILSDGGLCRVRGTEPSVPIDPDEPILDRFTANAGLSSNLVHTLFEDREGNIWVGTSLGLDRFRAANIVADTRVPAGYRARFLQSTASALYAYTGWSRTAASATDGSQSLYRILPHQPPKILIRNVGRLRGMHANEATGTLWLTTSKGVQQLLGAQLAPPIVLPKGVVADFVYSAVQDKSGALWISAFHGGVFRRQRGVWQPVAVRSNFSATAVLIPDPSGSMWVRYSGGTLYRVSGELIEDFSKSGLDIGDVTLIKPDARGLLIAGESGIARFDGKKFYSLRASRVPALSVVMGVAETADGSTWIYTQAGILRVASQGLEAALRNGEGGALSYELFDPRDGLSGAPYGAVYGSSAATAADGRVWFTTGQGLVWIDPKNLHRNAIAPTVLIRSLTVGDRVYDQPANVRLAPDSENLQIDYTALSLTTPERNQFRYRLDGVDKNWVDARDRRQAFYTKLGPGEYRFHVVATNNDGVWNQAGASLIFTIPPTFLQSIWFTILCVAVALTLLWTWYWYRLRQVAARIRERLEGRMSERERIARELHDTLLQGFHGLLLRFQAVAEQIPAAQPARKLMESALDRADEVLVEGRDRVRDLRLSNAGEELSEELGAAVAQMPIAPNPDVRFRLSVEGMPRDLHPIIFAEMSAIGKEALLNAFKHSNARTIEVKVIYGRRELRLRIHDDGAGISRQVRDAGGRDGHFGLTGMRERAEKIRAEFSILSEPGGGTEVVVTVSARIAYVRSSRPWALFNGRR